MDLSKIIAAANQHRVHVPKHAETIEYRIQLHNLNGWEDHDSQPQDTMGLKGFSDCLKWRDELIAAGDIVRIVAIVEVS